MQLLISQMERAGFESSHAANIAQGVLILFIIILCVAADLITRGIVLKTISRMMEKNKPQWNGVLLRHKVYQHLAHLLTPIIIILFADYFPAFTLWIQRGAVSYLIVIILLISNAFLNAVNDLYLQHEVSKEKPIKGFLQAVKICVFAVGIILIIAKLIGESPIMLLGGIGALTAIISLVFKDSILGFVAGIQLSANDMVRIGDWIEMPKYEADGTVTEISLNTVKVENFDRTITTIPAYALISDAFKNWRGIEAAGGRRIKRALYIDAASIAFYTDEEIENLKKIETIREYIEKKQQEIKQYNQEHVKNLEMLANGRRQTNLGVFRIYILNYIKRHPGIHKDMIQMVRQLPYNGRGVPIEIYAFTNDTNWARHENIQADLFDHILSVVPQFGLRLFQEPTGHDMRRAFGSDGE